MPTGRPDDYGEVIADVDGNLLEILIYGNYYEPIPSHCFQGITALEMINSLPECGLHAVRKRAIWALRTMTRQPFYYKHPMLWDNRYGEAIPVDDETVILRVSQADAIKRRAS